MRLSLAYITNRGKLRSRNEDALLVGESVISGVSMERPELSDMEALRILLAVADGMGGMPCGDRASRLALEYITGSWPGSVEEVKELLKRVTLRMNEFVSEHPECFGMGTALAGVFLGEEKGVAFNVGDCRVYRLRERLELLTRDHTEAYELYEEGVIDEEGIRHHPLRNVLTSALMGGYPLDLKVHVREIDVMSGDSFLICSDGLWDELSNAEIEECMGLGVEEGARRLFERAYEGGRDNISFILFRAL